MGLHLPAEEHL